MLTINTLKMAKVEVKQTPRQLNPYGEKLMKIWYDDSEPPKNYIWYKDEEYNYWNGNVWEPFELWTVQPEKEHHGHKHNCCCDEKAKFEKYKKDVLASVLKLIKSQNPESASALLARIETLERDVDRLKQINHDLFVKNSELESLLDSLGYAKLSDIADLDQLTNINNRLTAAEQNINTNATNISNNASNISNHESRISALESASGNNYDARITALENAGYITEEALEGYATQNYVDTAIINANIPRSLSVLNNDCGFITLSDLPEISSYDDSELRGRIGAIENANYNGRIASLDNRVTTLENKPFDEYLTSEEEQVISASLNDLNGRVVTLEAVDSVTHNDLDNYYTKQESDNKYEPKMIDITEQNYNQLDQPQQDVVYNIISGE